MLDIGGGRQGGIKMLIEIERQIERGKGSRRECRQPALAKE